MHRHIIIMIIRSYPIVLCFNLENSIKKRNFWNIHLEYVISWFPWAKDHLCCLLTAKEELVCACRRDFPGDPSPQTHFAYTSSSGGCSTSSQLEGVHNHWFWGYAFIFHFIFIMYNKEGAVSQHQFFRPHSFVSQVLKHWLLRWCFPRECLALYKG